MASLYFIFEKRLAQTHHTLTRVYHNPQHHMEEACANWRMLQLMLFFAKSLFSRWEFVSEFEQNKIRYQSPFLEGAPAFVRKINKNI